MAITRNSESRALSLSLSLSELSLNIQDLDLVSCCGPLCYVDSLPFLLSQTTRKLFSLSSLLFLFLNCALYINFFPSKSIPHFRNGCGAGAAHTNTHTHLVPELEETAENIFVFFFFFFLFYFFPLTDACCYFCSICNNNISNL